MGYPVMIGNTTRPLVFLLISSTDHLSGLTGVTPVVKISKNGAAGISPSGAITAVDAPNLPGWYRVAANATDANAYGPLLLHATATGADPCDEEFQVVNYNPDANLASDIRTVMTVPVATPTPGSNIYFNELFTTLPGIYISGVTSDSSANGYYSFSGASSNGFPVYTGSNYKLWVNGSYQWQLSLITVIGPNPEFISPGLAISLPYGLSLSVLSGGAIGTAVISQPAANTTQMSTSAAAVVATSVLGDTTSSDWATPGTPGYQLMNGGGSGGLTAGQAIQLNAIASAVVSSPIVVQQPVVSGTLYVNSGDDYPSGNAWQFGVPSGFMSLTGSTPTIDITQLVGGVPSGTPVLSITGTVQTGTFTINGVQYSTILQFTPTAAQTALLTQWAPNAYVYRVRCKWTTPSVQTITVVEPSPCTVLW